MLTVLDLFSGIGGFSLGLERTGGFRTVAFCEIEPYPRAVLAKHWPEVPCYDDVRTLDAVRLRTDGIRPVDVICGGFPCQDISYAGLGAGLDGARSGLWSEIARLVGELRPRYVIVENVSALLARGLERVLGDLAALGYDAEWHCIPAAAVGAPHRRDRIWIVAYSALMLGDGGSDHAERDSQGTRAVPEPRNGGRAAHVADAGSGRCGEPGERQDELAWRAETGGASEDVADAESGGPRRGRERPETVPLHGGAGMANAERARLEGHGIGRLFGQGWRGSSDDARASGWWSVEPDVGRVAHGVPARVDRLKGLGNAVVPQIPELIGRAILASLVPA